MTKVYNDGTCRCKECFRLFWPKNKSELVCLNCLQDLNDLDNLQDNKKENDDDILTQLTEMLKYMVFFTS